MEEHIMKQIKQEKSQDNTAKNEIILTCVGVVFILVLTIGTVYSFDARNERMLEAVAATSSMAGARG